MDREEALFRAAVAELAAIVGVEVPARAFDDEHERWPIYEKSWNRPEAWPALLRLVGLEPVPGLGVTIALQMVEVVDDADQDRWVRAVPPEDQGFPRWRAREVRIARTMAGEGAVPAEVDVEQWSDWLQRRVSEESSRLGVLDALAVEGRTRRVRAVAAQRAAQARKRIP
ncbi:hypothetical protein [Cellulomonas sp. ICMP 17802]|uniref:hypothetical protein n=1 Tax=Cellulomonas sp. ICMP 17802 TaxID=3239199 RepID=UPI00351B0FAF